MILKTKETNENVKVCEITEDEFVQLFAAVTTDFVVDNEKIFSDDFGNFVALLSLTAELQSALRKKMFGKEDEDNEEEREFYDDEVS